ncbi:FAD-dependent oxidoreductase [Ornithinimicrobium cavernae]|uniref:FAD-dependent oxidoreductase n=1 Tax=Ornithinimicrobium cavernae TaxID=2666047 RepID=UPI000D6893AF|nr:FAD-dependent oxidoreductase [Ornithinimicrobium cavernae]
MAEPLTCDVALVGAGPAGMMAALTAADHGLRVTVVDEQRRPGGQIFRQRPPEFPHQPWTPPAGYPWASSLLERAESATDIDWRFQTTALGVVHEERDDGILLATTGPGGSALLRARRLVIATGAFDMPVPVPGWTLPGVMMAGAVQTLLKSQQVLAAERLVLAGSHPLLLLVADQLRSAGADVAEVALARGLPTPREALGSLGAVPGHLSLLGDSARAVARLVAGGVRISPRTVVTAAHGHRHVEAVSLTQVDRQWRGVGQARRVEADALVLGYGFQPSAELARQAGCAMRWDSPAGGWVVAHDDRMATDVPGVYAAGEPVGVSGAEMARSQGRLAGLGVVSDLTGHNVDVELEEADRSARRARRFARVVQRMFAPQREALADLAGSDTVVCRCELVSRGAIEQVLDANPGMSTANAVKLECRSGMGPCQGRYCETTVGTLVAGRTGRPVAQVGHFTAHFPIKPVPLSVLGELDGDVTSGACAHRHHRAEGSQESGE